MGRRDWELGARGAGMGRAVRWAAGAEEGKGFFFCFYFILVYFYLLSISIKYKYSF
jgi:hypothetical protein